MACNTYSFGVIFFFSLSLHYVTHSTPTPQELHIVYLGRKSNTQNKNHKLITSRHHLRLLTNVFSSYEDAKQSMVYSYRHSFSGFSAMLNSSQVAALAKRREVISVFKSKTMRLHTTRSWDFMGLGFPNDHNPHPLQLSYGHDIIVGVIDSGIWPESESFHEEPGISEVPRRWKGKCTANMTCNRKLIGARFYAEGYEATYGPVGSPEYRSPRDMLGHGTHTASTAVGSTVPQGTVSFLGLAGHGIARGGAPRARLAVYKACWGNGEDYSGQCSDADVLAAFDDAISDGVHVISASIGSAPPLPELFASGNSVGSFHAAEAGVVVVFAAGNDGPDPGLVANVEPWAVSVAASTLDRTFETRVVVERNFSVTGESFITEPISGKLVDPITYFTNGADYRKNSRTAKGRVLLCFSTVGPVDVGEAQGAALAVNASALIIAQPLPHLVGPDMFPTLYLDIFQGTKLKHYLALFLRVPKIEIQATKTRTGNEVAPRVAFFSSRGPSSLSPDILKPDITAPGVNILAAWPRKTSPTVAPSEVYKNVEVSWNIISGTSMACPHVSGIVALLRSAHPSWSPAIIKSALITTAYSRDASDDLIANGESMKLSDPFDIGGGHVNPIKAMEPGLVYDTKTSDYIIFLCSLGYTSDQIKSMFLQTQETTTTTITLCRNKYSSVADINQPSVTVSDLRSTVTVKRTVRNVGQSRFAAYFIDSLVEPNGVKVVVWPRVLVFSWFRDEMSYYVTLSPAKKSRGRYDFGEIVWSDGFHSVRTPIVVRVNTVVD